MKNETYFELRNENCYKKIASLLDRLPDFVSEFILGIENTTTPLTRLNYAYDICSFLIYLSEKKYKKPIADITLLDIDNLEITDIELYLSYLNNYYIDEKRRKCNERAKARKLAAIRSMFKYFFNKDRLTANIATKISMPKIRDKEIIRLESNEVIDILQVADTGDHMTNKQKQFNEITSIRDVAILSLFLGTGIRISELVGINVNDLDFNVNGFTITRKGGAQVILYFNDEVAVSLKSYLDVRNANTELDKDEQALFISLQNRRISVRAVENLVKKYAKIVSPLKKISPHKLRSTFGTELYRETKDIYIVADVLGHKDVNTTKKHYAAISEDLRKEAAEKVKLRKDDE